MLTSKLSKVTQQCGLIYGLVCQSHKLRGQFQLQHTLYKGHLVNSVSLQEQIKVK